MKKDFTDMAYATLDDLLQVEPNIQEYGVIEWDFELARSEAELNRVLTVRWWQSYRKRLGLSDSAPLDPTLFDPAQWTTATVYHALAYHICPKLTQFSPETDRFQVMMDYYRGRFEHEMDLCIREGVRYDANDNGTLEDTEKMSDHNLRLRR
jgi:hypothetical protein